MQDPLTVSSTRFSVNRPLPALLLLLQTLLFPAGNVAGAAEPTGPKRFAVDFLTLKTGTQLRGALLGKDDDGVVSMAVQRDWLTERRPALLAEHIRQEQAEALRNATILADRIRAWIADTTEPQLKIAFLQTELDRATMTLTALAKPAGVKTQFVVLRIPRQDIRSTFQQSPRNRQIAVVAWSEQLKDIERREATDLLAELKQHGITDPATEPVDLTDRVPAQPETAHQWAARQAIIDYHFGRKLNFQGMGGALFRTGDGAKPLNLSQLLPQLLQAQLGSLNVIGEILGEPGFGPQKPGPAGHATGKALATAIATAEREKVSCFRVTQVELQIARRQAQVRQQFLVHMPDASWQAVWQTTVTQDASKPRPGLEQQIQDDPQIGQVLKLAGGLGGARGNPVETAVRFGGATMEAQKTADRQFFEFRDRFVRRLDSAPLQLSK